MGAQMTAHDLQDRTAIVTGASSGIGLRTADRLAEAGARVVLFARSREEIERVAGAAPDQMHAVTGDLTDESDIERLFAETAERFGPCDILVNNAGALTVRPLVRLSTEEWDRVFAVNVRAVFLTCRFALASMIERKRGAIVNVASISGVQGSSKFPGVTSYCASKGAVISLTEALAAEVKSHGIRVNAVSPGSVDTPMLRKANPLAKPDMTPDEVAEVILFLASDRSRPINGQNIHVFSS